MLQGDRGHHRETGDSTDATGGSTETTGRQGAALTLQGDRGHHRETGDSTESESEIGSALRQMFCGIEKGLIQCGSAILFSVSEEEIPAPRKMAPENIPSLEDLLGPEVRMLTKKYFRYHRKLEREERAQRNEAAPSQSGLVSPGNSGVAADSASHNIVTLLPGNAAPNTVYVLCPWVVPVEQPSNAVARQQTVTQQRVTDPKPTSARDGRTKRKKTTKRRSEPDEEPKHFSKIPDLRTRLALERAVLEDRGFLEPEHDVHEEAKKTLRKSEKKTRTLLRQGKPC